MASRSSGSDAPARAPEPRGSTSTRARASRRRSWSRTSPHAWAPAQWPNVIGSAARVCVKPGMTASAPSRPFATRADTRAASASAQPVDRPAGPEPERRDRLLVPAAAEVGLAGEVTDDLAQPLLDEAVHVLDVRVEKGGVRLHPARTSSRPRSRVRRVVRRDRAAPAERADPGARRGDLLADEAPVEGEGPVELPEHRVGRRLVVAAPELHAHLAQLPVVGVDVDVAVREVGGPHPAGGLALAEADAQPHRVLPHRRRGRLLVVRARGAALRHVHVADPDRDAAGVERDARAAHRGQDAAPVRVAPVESRLDERRLGHRAGDPVGVRCRPRPLDAHLGDARHALAVPDQHVRELPGRVGEREAEGVEVAVPRGPWRGRGARRSPGRWRSRSSRCRRPR